MLLNASRHELQSNYDLLHIDFDNAIEYIVERAGNVNVYDIKIDGDYEGINENNTELLQPYFNNPEYQRLYNLNPAIVYDSQSEDVYNNLFTDFMMPEVSRVQYLLGKGMNVLIYNGQDDLIVQNPGTMKWVDRLHHDSAEEFRAKLFSPWKINGKVVGSIKSAGLL